MAKMVIKSKGPNQDELRQKAKRWDKMGTEYRQNEDGTRSTHKMASGEYKKN